MRLGELLLHGRSEKRHSVTTIDDYFVYSGQQYPLGALPLGFTQPGQTQPAVSHSFVSYAQSLFKSNAVVFSLESKRVESFSQIRFQFQRLTAGRPGGFWSDSSLDVLNDPPGQATGQDLLAGQLLTADLAGTCYHLRTQQGLVWLRPDWVDVVFALHPSGAGVEVAGYRYHVQGRSSGDDPIVLDADDVAAFTPKLDPEAPWRGMSWLTPVIREVQADNAARDHKLKFFENAATPNLFVSLKESVSKEQFDAFVDKMNESHQGVDNAYRTLYMGGGADVTVVGSNLQQMDFKTTQGHGETRMCMAAGVPPTVANSTEGMQGSSLNAGNFGQARRQFADMTLHPLWMNSAGSFSRIVPAPADSRLWYDARDVPLLREDAKDAAEIQRIKVASIRQLVDSGFTAESVIAAIDADDIALLEHTGLFSVQLQKPGAQPIGDGRSKVLRVLRDENGVATGFERVEDTG